jgi:hypothetical protein
LLHCPRLLELVWLLPLRRTQPAFTSAQRAACGGDAQRLCSSSMSDPQQLTACMQSNQSKVSSRCRAAMGGGGKKKKAG